MQAIPAQSTINDKPRVGFIKAIWSTAIERQNPKACADISKKPVQTVSS